MEEKNLLGTMLKAAKSSRWGWVGVQKENRRLRWGVSWGLCTCEEHREECSFLGSNCPSRFTWV
jgi:hypothetical protein